MTLVQTFIYDNVNQRLKVSMMCIDINGFFSSIPATWLVEELNHIEVSTVICRWLFSFLTDCQVSIVFNNQTSPMFACTDKGVAQRSSLSPLLSTFWVQTFLKEVPQPNMCNIMFIDDLAMIVANRAWEDNIKDLHSWVKDVKAKNQERKLSFAMKKSKLIHFNKGQLD